MFEFQDPQLGRVKVVNVTEARASIASIMSDRNFSYIITKNSKPIRVIINYANFKETLSVENLGKGNVPFAGFLETQEKEASKPRKESSPIPPTPEITTDDEDYWSVGQEEAPVLSETIIEENPLEILPEPEAVKKPEVPQIETRTPPPDDEYFARFRKLYDNPPKPVAGSSPSLPPVFSKPEAPPPPMPEIPDYSAAAKQTKQIETPSPLQPEPKPKEEGHRPSIQDLLKELEMEKLSGEDEG